MSDRLPRLLIPLLGLVLATPAVAALQPADYCTGNPCVVAQDMQLEFGTLDFGAGTELRIAENTRLTIGPPDDSPISVHIIAGSIVLEPGARIVGRGKVVDGRPFTRELILEALTGDIELQARGARSSRLDLNGSDG